MAWGKILSADDNSVKNQIQDIARQLRENRLQSMFLIPSFVPVNGENAMVIAEAMQDNTSLTELYLSGHNLGEQGCAMMGKAIENHQTLQRVSVGHQEIGSDHIQLRALLTPVFKSKSVMHVDLAKRTIDTAAIPVLLECFANNSKVTSVDLSQNEITDDALALLAPLFLNSNLITVNLAINHFTSKGLAALGDSMSEMIKKDRNQRSTVQRINIGSNVLGDDGANQVARLIGLFPSLVCIEMNDCQAGSSTGALGEVIGRWARGEQISAQDSFEDGLAFCQGLAGGDESGGATAITPPLHSQLKHMVLRGCNIQDEGVSHIVESIYRGRLPRLMLLDIANNQLSSRAVEMLGGVIATPGVTSSIEVLDLSCNDLGLEGKHQICSWIESGRLEKLTCLAINNIGINIDDMVDIVKLLISHPPPRLRVIESMSNFKKSNQQDQEQEEEEEDDMPLLELLDQLSDTTNIDFKWK